MKWYVLILALAVVGCQRDSGFLYEIKPPHQTILQTPPPTEPPVPPVHSDKVYDLKIASSSDVIPAVDILWVIDNSGSMAPYQQAVIQNTQLFMQNFTGNTRLTWKMGLISTDESQQPFLGFTPTTLLNANTPNPVATFQAAVGLETTNGSDIEKTYGPVLNVLAANPSFHTPGAYFAMVVVTDEEEQTTTGSLSLPLPTSKFLNQLGTLVGGKNKIVTYGVFETEEKCGQNGFLYATSRWKQLIDQTHGKKFSLCDPQFGQVLSDLGTDLIQTISTLHPVITLESHPIPSTIQVRYNNILLKSGFFEDGGQWVYDPVENIIKITDTSILDGKIPQIEIAFDVDTNYQGNP